jgi:hypothetical protein
MMRFKIPENRAKTPERRAMELRNEKKELLAKLAALQRFRPEPAPR